jgi:LysM repeat protein
MKARSSDFDRAVQADIADLWANDRRQDDRLTTIERKLNQNTGGDTARPYRRGYETNQSDDVYTVQYGDSLSEIAARFGTTKDAIRAKNHLDSDWLEEGQRLTIPNKRISSSYSKPAPVASSKTKTSNSSVHYVKAGESLSSIAKGYGMSLATLLAANHLSNPDKLSVGQRLSIPSNASYRAPVRKTSPQKVTTKPTPQYVTKPITTKSYTPPSIALANASEKGAEKSASTLRGVASYRVEQGDTLDSIATTFNTSSEEIRRINALNRGYKPQHGDELVVPSPAPVAL